MNNGDKPINPIFTKEGHYRQTDAIFSGTLHGLTKREYFAGVAMQGIICNPESPAPNWERVAEHAVCAADALLKELEKTSFK